MTDSTMVDADAAWPNIDGICGLLEDSERSDFELTDGLDHGLDLRGSSLMGFEGDKATGLGSGRRVTTALTSNRQRRSKQQSAGVSLSNPSRLSSGKNTGAYATSQKRGSKSTRSHSTVDPTEIGGENDVIMEEGTNHVDASSSSSCSVGTTSSSLESDGTELENAEDSSEILEAGKHMDARELQLQHRRARNRKHAKETRRRKKESIDAMQRELDQLRDEKKLWEHHMAVIREQGKGGSTSSTSTSLSSKVLASSAHQESLAQAKDSAALVQESVSVVPGYHGISVMSNPTQTPESSRQPSQKQQQPPANRGLGVAIASGVGLDVNYPVLGTRSPSGGVLTAGRRDSVQIHATGDEMLSSVTGGGVGWADIAESLSGDSVPPSTDRRERSDSLSLWVNSNVANSGIGAYECDDLAFHAAVDGVAPFTFDGNSGTDGIDKNRLENGTGELGLSSSRTARPGYRTQPPYASAAGGTRGLAPANVGICAEIARRSGFVGTSQLPGNNLVRGGESLPMIGNGASNTTAIVSRRELWCRRLRAVLAMRASCERDVGAWAEHVESAIVCAHPFTPYRSHALASKTAGSCRTSGIPALIADGQALAVSLAALARRGLHRSDQESGSSLAGTSDEASQPPTLSGDRIDIAAAAAALKRRASLAVSAPVGIVYNIPSMDRSGFECITDGWTDDADRPMSTTVKHAPSDDNANGLVEGAVSGQRQEHLLRGASTIFFSETGLVCAFSMRTLNLTSNDFGLRREVSKSGHIRCLFHPSSQRMMLLEFTFDAISTWRQMHYSSGLHGPLRITPNLVSATGRRAKGDAVAGTRASDQTVSTVSSSSSSSSSVVRVRDQTDHQQQQAEDNGEEDHEGRIWVSAQAPYVVVHVNAAMGVLMSALRAKNMEKESTLSPTKADQCRSGKRHLTEVLSDEEKASTVPYFTGMRSTSSNKKVALESSHGDKPTGCVSDSSLTGVVTDSSASSLPDKSSASGDGSWRRSHRTRSSLDEGASLESDSSESPSLESSMINSKELTKPSRTGCTPSFRKASSDVPSSTNDNTNLKYRSRTNLRVRARTSSTPTTSTAAVAVSRSKKGKAGVRITEETRHEKADTMADTSARPRLPSSSSSSSSSSASSSSSNASASGSSSAPASSDSGEEDSSGDAECEHGEDNSNSAVGRWPKRPKHQPSKTSPCVPSSAAVAAPGTAANSGALESSSFLGKPLNDVLAGLFGKHTPTHVIEAFLADCMVHRATSMNAVMSTTLLNVLDHEPEMKRTGVEGGNGASDATNGSMEVFVQLCPLTGDVPSPSPLPLPPPPTPSSTDSASSTTRIAGDATTSTFSSLFGNGVTASASQSRQIQLNQQDPQHHAVSDRSIGELMLIIKQTAIRRTRKGRSSGDRPPTTQGETTSKTNVSTHSSESIRAAGGAPSVSDISSFFV